MRPDHQRSYSTMSLPFDDACALVETAVQGAVRQEIVAAVSNSKDLGAALRRLRDGLGSNVLLAGARRIEFKRLVATYDRRNREDGLHVLHDWDGVADSVNEDTIPVDVLNYLVDKRGDEPVDRTVLAIFVDYYLLYLLALLSLRVWDEGDPDENLDWLGRLLHTLQGPGGSGQRFAENAETLILIATSHYELEARGYDRLLERVRTLNRAHRTEIALSHAACMGGHLRFGFEASYIRDVVLMRDDNVADYPWLSFALSTLMDEYARLHAAGTHGVTRETIVEGMMNGLSPDARAFMGDQPPASLSSCAAEGAEFRERFHAYKPDLLEEGERHRPEADAYSPISFFFNFSQNVLKGTVIDALLRGAVWELTLNDLLTGVPRGGAESAARTDLATTLMGHARLSPNTIRGRKMPVIVYDPHAGRRAFTVTIRRLQGLDVE